jgi:hypothetical protein
MMAPSTYLHLPTRGERATHGREGSHDRRLDGTGQVAGTLKRKSGGEGFERPYRGQHGRGWGGLQVPFDEIERGWADRRETLTYTLRARFVGSKQALARRKFATRFEWKAQTRTISTREAGSKREPLPHVEFWETTPAEGLVPTWPYGVGFTPRSESQPYVGKPKNDLREMTEEGIEVEIVPRIGPSGEPSRAERPTERPTIRGP